MANLDQLVDDLSTLTVLEAAELSKMLEEKWGVSAAAPVAVAAAGGGAAAADAGRGADRVRRHPGRLRREEDQRDQGSPRDHRPRPEGGQRPGRGGAEGGQGRRQQGRSRQDQEAARRCGRDRRDQVDRDHDRSRHGGLAVPRRSRRVSRRLRRRAAAVCVRSIRAAPDARRAARPCGVRLDVLSSRAQRRVASSDGSNRSRSAMAKSSHGQQADPQELRAHPRSGARCRT